MAKYQSPTRTPTLFPSPEQVKFAPWIPGSVKARALEVICGVTRKTRAGSKTEFPGGPAGVKCAIRICSEARFKAFWIGLSKTTAQPDEIALFFDAAWLADRDFHDLAKLRKSRASFAYKAKQLLGAKPHALRAVLTMLAEYYPDEALINRRHPDSNIDLGEVIHAIDSLIAALNRLETGLKHFKPDMGHFGDPMIAMALSKQRFSRPRAIAISIAVMLKQTGYPVHRRGTIPHIQRLVEALGGEGISDKDLRKTVKDLLSAHQPG